MESTSDHFPVGLRVLVVDDDPICLLIVERLLRSCLYQVTTCKEAVIALSMLRENRSRFDVVLSDVHMPDMDGFKLLELVRLEMDVPVIMMSANGETSNVMKGISQGACDYLLKPVRLEELQNIWQHVVRKEHKTLKESEHAPNPKDYQRPRQMQTDGNVAVLPADEENGFCSSQRKRKGPFDEDSANEEEDNLAAVKRQRVVWSVDLHQKFISAINHLGLEQAVPKRILDLMNVPGLTRENVASHLQKYRIYLKRMSGGSVNQQLGMARCIGPTGSFMNSLAFMNGFSNSQAVGQFSRQAMLTPQLGISGGGHGLESMDGDFIGVMKAGTDPCMDYKEYVMAQYLDPTLQGHFGLASSAKDSKLSTVPQNTLGFSLLQQSLGVPKSSGILFSGGPSCNELSASGTDHLFMHQLQTVAELRALGYNDSLSGSELVER